MNVLKKIKHWVAKKNIYQSLFISSFLIYATIVVIVTSISLDFGRALKNNWDAYSGILALIGILIYLRLFVITYSNLRQHLQKERTFAIGFDAILFALVIFLVSFSIEFLRENANPQNSIALYSACAAIFYIQLFLSQAQPLLKTTFFNFAYYVIGVIIFYGFNRFGIGDSRFISTSLNTFSYVAGAFELYLFFQIIRHAFKNQPE